MNLSGTGPASARLIDDVVKEVQERGLLFWLDKDAHYTELVDRMAEAKPPFPVLRYRGSYLDLMLALAPHTGGASKRPVLVHLPGFVEEDVKAGPLLESWEMGTRYRKKLTTLVSEAAHGLAPPDDIEARLKDADLTLASADAWLGKLATGQPHRVTARLQGLSLPALLVDLQQELDRTDDATPGFWAAVLSDPDDRALVDAWLHAVAGMPPAWRESIPAKNEHQSELQRIRDMRFAIVGWALCVEYVHDLRREPVQPMLLRHGLTTLPKEAVACCRQVATHLRAQDPTSYRELANQTQAALPLEVAKAQPDDLGSVDTFAFEEDVILKGALAALEAEDWSRALAWSAPRCAEGSFWTRDTQGVRHRTAWSVVQATATLGAALQAAGTALEAPHPFPTLREAIDRYVAQGAPVDRAHRHLLQLGSSLEPRLPHFHRLKAIVARMRGLHDEEAAGSYRTWADNWNRDLCELMDRVGVLPDEDLQQRTLFDDLVVPAARKDQRTVAYVMVDALRFEMAQELMARIAGEPDTDTHLAARLCELPSVTEVGMNVLAGVALHGKLMPEIKGGEIKGMRVGSYVVNDHKTRVRAMQDKVGHPVPFLDVGDVLDASSEALRKAVQGHRLVVVHTLAIDAAGEKGLGLKAYDSILRDLASMWRRLREAGVKTFIITSDHGFLLLEPQDHQALSHGRTVDAKRRHVLAAHAEKHPGELCVSTKDLNYDLPEPRYVMSPTSTQRFADGQKVNDFAHGGPSFAERVIPVLTVTHKRAYGSSHSSYTVQAHGLAPTEGLHHLRGRVQRAHDHGLAFASDARIALTLDAPEDADVLVDICDARGAGRLTGGVVDVAVDADFEVSFRVTASAEKKVQVRLRHPGTESVEPFVVPSRFLALARPPAPGVDEDEDDEDDEPTVRVPALRMAWLRQLPAMYQPVFAHLAQHGEIDELALTHLLGSPRAARTFARKVEELAAMAAFDVLVQTGGGTKRYVRVGGPS